jgi:hypothetical protein
MAPVDNVSMSTWPPAPGSAASTHAALVMALRGTDHDAAEAAAAALWVRHYPSVVRAARDVVVLPDDAEYVAAEAFGSALVVWRSAGGDAHSVADEFPSVADLITAEVARAAAARAEAGVGAADPAVLDEPDAAHREPLADALELSVVREAFSSLPAASRAALWQVAVRRSESDRAAGVERGADDIAAAITELRSAYVATLLARGAAVPACRPYLSGLPALVAGENAAADVLIHAAGCHRCTRRLESLREVVDSLPEAVLPLLAPITAGTGASFVSAPAAGSVRLDIVPHARLSASPLVPPATVRWAAGAGLAASAIAAVAAISMVTTPAADEAYAGRPGARSSPDFTSRGTDPTVNAPRNRSQVPVGPDAPGTPGVESPTPGPAVPSPGVRSPSSPGGRPPSTSPPRSPTSGSSAPAPTTAVPGAPVVQVDLGRPRVGADVKAEVVAVAAAGATELRLSLEVPVKATVAAGVDTGDWTDCRMPQGGLVTCVATPVVGKPVEGAIHLEWPTGLAGEVTADVESSFPDGTTTSTEVTEPLPPTITVSPSPSPSGSVAQTGAGPAPTARSVDVPDPEPVTDGIDVLAAAPPTGE